MNKIGERIYFLINFLTLFILFLLSGMTMYNFDHHAGNLLYRKLDKRFVRTEEKKLNPTELVSLCGEDASAIFAIDDTVGYVYDPNFVLAEELDLVIGEQRYFNEEDYRERKPVFAEVNGASIIDVRNSSGICTIGLGAILYQPELEKVGNLLSLDQMPKEVLFHEAKEGDKSIENWLIEGGYQEAAFSQKNILYVLFQRRDRIHPILTIFSSVLIPLYGTLFLVTGTFWHFIRKKVDLAVQLGMTWNKAIFEQVRKIFFIYLAMLPLLYLLSIFSFGGSYYELSFANFIWVYLLHTVLSLVAHGICIAFMLIKRKGGK